MIQLMPFELYKPGQLGLALNKKSDEDSDSLNVESD